MISIKNNTKIEASLDEVWQLFVNLNQRYSEISRNHISLKCIEGLPNQIGSIYKIRNHFKGKIIEVKYRLIEFTQNERIIFYAEFPHALLGLKLIYNFEGNDSCSFIYEEIQLGSKVLFLSSFIDSALKLYLCSYFNSIINDQKERMAGLQNIFQKERIEL